MEGMIPLVFFTESDLTVFGAFLTSIVAVEQTLYFSAKQRRQMQGTRRGCTVLVSRISENQ